jgi:murein DD-endopeptidase MepM/ murein hydrolase activator NlpD
VHRYKAAEVRAVDSARRLAAAVGRPVSRGWRGFVQLGNQKFTVMFIPHSERKIFNLRMSMFGLLFTGLLLAGVLVVFVSLSTDFTSTHERFLATSRSLAASETTVESIGDEVKELQRVVTEFRRSLESVLNVVGTDTARGYLTGGVGGDLASFVSESLVIANDVRSLTELRSLRAYLEGAIGPLREIESALLAQKELLVDIPSLWPIQAGKGYITADFGPGIHPFTGRWYIHKGIDIAWLRGTEVVATANGKVQRVAYEPYNLGHFVVIRHKYGFVTVYGHLNQKPVVKPGRQVERGAVLGYLGSTGLSTGPHLHYEVRIAEQVVNPRQFLSIVASSRGGAAAR